MRIGACNNIKNTYLKTNTTPANKFIMKSDTFVRSTSFGSNNIARNDSDDKSFSEFKEWCKKTNFVQKAEEIVERTGMILGSGFEGQIFEIPDNDKWVIKRYKRGNIVQIPSSKPKIVKIEDIAPQLNIGQVIARLEIPKGSRLTQIYYILKKQTGKPHSVPFELSDQISENNISTHINSLKLLADCPDSTFEKCLRDVLYVNSQGYEIDCCNPCNFLVDSDKKTINFVDITDKSKSNDNQIGNVLFALLGSSFGINLLNSDISSEDKEEAQELSNRITDKYFKAMKKLNIKFNGGKYFEKLINSRVLDNILNSNTSYRKYLSLIRQDLI